MHKYRYTKTAEVKVPDSRPIQTVFLQREPGNTHLWSVTRLLKRRWSCMLIMVMVRSVQWECFWKSVQNLRPDLRHTYHIRCQFLGPNDQFLYYSYTFLRNIFKNIFFAILSLSVSLQLRTSLAGWWENRFAIFLPICRLIQRSETINGSVSAPFNDPSQIHFTHSLTSKIFRI